MLAHMRLFASAGYSVSVLAGRGAAQALPQGVRFHDIPLLDSQHPRVTALQKKLDQGEVPENFDDLQEEINQAIEPILSQVDHLIVHNVFTKHFNLPLTAALANLLARGVIRHGLAWCHDFSWTSTSSRSRVFPGEPWDLLRTRLPGLTYVTVSKSRQATLARLLNSPTGEIKLAYNGVDPVAQFGLTPLGTDLVDQLGLMESDLVLMMPVRITQAKNIEYGLQVAAALKESGLRIKLVITGPPDPHDSANMTYYRSLLSLRAELGLDRQAHFIYELGDRNTGSTIAAPVVGELLRASDLLFMPSHREGFGMPIVEAGLVGTAVWCTDVPAAAELGGENVNLFELTEAAESVAKRILTWAQQDQRLQFRRLTRQSLTWQAIFDRDIQPLMQVGRQGEG
jgi:glycosyltransferase involved in cell wall biosynthesis